MSHLSFLRLNLFNRFISARTMGSINSSANALRGQAAISTTNNSQANNKGFHQNLSKMFSSCGRNVIEKEVCHVDDIANNEMKEFQLDDDKKVLLIKKNEQFFAIGTKCPHYGAPLIKGALSQNRIRCPWHGACFNLETGDIEDFPGLDSIPCYQVKITDKNQVKIIANKNDLEKNKRVKEMIKRNTCDDRTFIVIGGGPSAGVCVETLRQEGFTGRILMICKENALPYDRVKVSKSLNIEIEKIQLRDMNFYEKHGIEILLDTEATKVDTTNHIVNCSNGYSIKYDKLFIATGCKPRTLQDNMAGSNLKNIMTIRNYTDGLRIMEILKPEMQVVCLGSSFIGLESAAYLVGKAKQVTVIGRDKFPLKASFGAEIGERILRLFEEKGVKMIMENGIDECIGNDDGVIKSIKLQSGDIIDCDLLILGIGTIMYTDFLKDSGIQINRNGSIDTDLHLRTNISDIYVGGDIANAPVYSISNQKAAIGHYQLAQYHGRIAALNMLGKMTELKSVPFFFTLLFGKGLRYSGYGKAHEVLIDGDLESMTFIAIYLNENGDVIAMASCNRDPIVAQFAEFQSQGRRLHKNDLKDDVLGWTKLISA